MKPKIKYTVVFIFNISCTKVMVILKNRPEWQRGCFNGIGGHMELNETPKQSIQREIFEETNLCIDPENLKLFHVLNPPKVKVYFFKTFLSEFMMNTFKSKTDERLSIFDINEFLQKPNIVSNLRWLIPMALDESHIESNSTSKH